MSELEQAKNTLNSILGHYEGFWAVAGGWAIDFYLEKKTREHKDIEIVIWRDEQQLLQSYFSSWEGTYYQKGVPFEWKKGEMLQLPIHELHFKKDDQGLEVLLNEHIDGEWIFRRDTTITHPVSTFFHSTSSGVNVLAPEIVLLYKAKEPKDYDTKDLQNALLKMSDNQKGWLFESVQKMYPDHPWLSLIKS